MSELVEVVSAVIVRRFGVGEPRILLTQRKPGQTFPFSWECPGGKVDGNESHHQAIRRECKEELGIDLLPIGDGLHPIWCGRLNTAGAREDRPEIFLLMYTVNYDTEVPPMPLEGQGIGWFTSNQMRDLYLAPGNIAALREITQFIKAVR